MAVSDNQIFTAGKDGDIRFFNLYSGASIGETFEEMECDHLAANGLHLLTRVGKGESMLVWKILQTGGVEEDPVGEVEFKEVDRRE